MQSCYICQHRSRDCDLNCLCLLDGRPIAGRTDCRIYGDVPPEECCSGQAKPQPIEEEK